MAVKYKGKELNNVFKFNKLVIDRTPYRADYIISIDTSGGGSRVVKEFKEVKDMKKSKHPEYGFYYSDDKSAIKVGAEKGNVALTRSCQSKGIVYRVIEIEDFNIKIKRKTRFKQK